MDTINRNRMLVTIAAVLILVTPVAAYALGFLDISLASVKTSSDKVDKATMVRHGFISKDGSKEAFGYGILTGDSAIVSTTHKGVLDSETQNGDKFNPVFHNHYVKLVNDLICGGGPTVIPDAQHITFDSPGKLTVSGSALSLNNLPKTSEGLSQDNNVEGVVSFKLDPKFTGDHLDAVCVTDIKPADRVKIN
jgi:hypothetical protein